jgi:predicted TIM-barrel fold metal-dependent hydrolase
LVGETVDSHVHLWDARHTPRPWMTMEHEAINRPFGSGDIIPLNVLAKVSGFNTALDEPNSTISDLCLSVETAPACFGPDPLVSASDWPYLPLDAEFDRVWVFTSQALAEGPAGTADRLLGANAQHDYRFADLPGTA